tara:strand:+ start:246 stop:476 length:231 start_codon:yes stop_codon:yes gene_type:complete
VKNARSQSLAKQFDLKRRMCMRSHMRFLAIMSLLFSLLLFLPVQKVPSYDLYFSFLDVRGVAGLSSYLITLYRTLD